jgi:hypothetical protein
MSRSRRAVQTEIAAIDAAIMAVLEGGQNVEVTTAAGSRKVQMADLKTLYAQRDRLRRSLRGGPVARQGIPI